MATRIKENQFKAVVFIFLFTFLILQTLLSNAQSYSRNEQDLYRGFVASFGTHIADVASDIEHINQSTLLQAGGQIGLVVGNHIVRSKVGLIGYYSSTGATATTDLYESNISMNFYPLSCISRKALIVEPYITGGLNYDRYKFYGYYLNREPGETNYSQIEAPLLGKIKQANASMGVGLEVKLADRFNFIHLFSEYTYAYNLSTGTDDASFKSTTLGNRRQLIVGISFGAHR